MSSYSAWMMKGLTALAVALAVAAGTASRAHADNSQAEASSENLEEIVVSATRKDESLSKVPESIVALGKLTMDEEGVRDISDIARLAPGISLLPLGGQDISGIGRTISIRGVSSNVGSATTGIYIDDTPIQTRALSNDTTNVYPEVFDLDRVEVLRGPQGTLFGAGAEGGAIRFITTQPSLTEYSTYARSELANTQHGGMSYEAGAATGGPIVPEELGFRISAWYRDDGGYTDRVDPTTGDVLQKNANKLDSSVIRTALAGMVRPDVKVTLSEFYQDLKSNGAPDFYQNISDPGTDTFRAARLLPQIVTDKFSLPTLNITYKGAGFDVISTTAYFNRTVDRAVDYSAFVGAVVFDNPYADGPGQYDEAFIDDTQKSFTQEIRIQSSGTSSFNWVFGAFYTHSDQTALQRNYDPFLADLVPGFPLLDGTDLLRFRDETLDQQKALFGQVDYEVVEGLKLIGGVRVSRDDVFSQGYSIGPIAGPGAGTTTTSSESELPVTPKYGISYQIDKANLVYATAAKGFRVGGLNGPLPDNCDTALAQVGLPKGSSTYSSDSLWSYEVGSKNSAFGGRLQVDASAFDIDWKKIQRQIQLASCGSSLIANFGNAKSTGFDLAVSVLATDRLTLAASVGYADARLTQDVVGPSPAGGGAAPVFGYNGDEIGGPPWSATAAADYVVPMSGERKAYGHVDFQHISGGASIDYRVYGADPEVGPSDSYNDMATRVGVRFSGWDVSLFVNNLLDQAPILTRRRDNIDAAADTLFFETTLRPRTYGVTVTYRD
jgi:outer membrane receptor protein involved in Fe transport